MPSQYSPYWLIVSGYTGLSDSVIDLLEAEKSSWQREQPSKHALRKMTPDCSVCCPRLAPGFTRLDREEIKGRVDMLALASTYGTVQRTGASHVMLCQFHKETRPSLIIYPAQKRYWCPSCNASGTCFDWVMELEGLSFVEAMRFLNNIV